MVASTVPVLGWCPPRRTQTKITGRLQEPGKVRLLPKREQVLLHHLQHGIMKAAFMAKKLLDGPHMHGFSMARSRLRPQPGSQIIRFSGTQTNFFYEENNPEP